MGAERSQWQFPANEVGKVIGWSDEASPSNPNASKGLVNKGPFATPADLDGKQDASANLDAWSALAPSEKQDASANLDAWSALATSAFKQLNADGGFTFATTAVPTINISGVFGGTYETSHRVHSTGATVSNSGTYVTMAVMNKATGLSASGATNSNVALWVEAEKDSYLTSTTEGQTLGEYNVVRHGRLGDGAGLLIDARKVFDGTYSGGMLGIETLIAKINSSGTITQHTQLYMGFSMSNTGTNFAPDGTIGFGVEPRVGETFAGFAAIERSDIGAGVAFEHVIAGSTSRDNANIFFNVTGTGHASGAGRVYAQGSAAFPAYSFIGDPNTGVVSPSADQVGFSAGGTTRFWVTTTGVNCTLPARFLNGFAIPANGSTGNGIMMSSTANFGIFFGSGAPTLSAAKGSLYLRSDGSADGTSSDRIYVNNNGSTGWTVIRTGTT